jgi:hypothetical protein
MAKASQHIYEPPQQGLPLIGVILMDDKVVVAESFRDRQEAEKRLRYIRTGFQADDTRRPAK